MDPASLKGQRGLTMGYPPFLDTIKAHMKSGLISRENSVLVVVDYQDKLMPHIHGRDAILRKAALLLHTAGVLGIPVIATEQYPRGLGSTIAEISGLIPGFSPVEKTCFSCMGEPEFVRRFEALGRKQAVIIGVETHVCVAQTALDLAGRDISSFVAADACGSRREQDYTLGLRRMEGGGVIVSGAEGVVFEWLRHAGTEEFKQVQAVVKSQG